jgi:serum/glucocorticoid-regulated kinase 2
MDLLTGGDLRYHICKNRKFSENQSKFFIGCILLGLEYCHRNKIIHRDIKPENLVLDSNGYVHITDFGIAKIQQLHNAKETSGTPGYMSPEVMCGHDHNILVDYFAVGVMGYEFLKGYRPYLGKNRKEIKEKMISHQAHIKKSDLVSYI